MKKVYLIGALLSFGLLAEAQSFMRFEDKAFNFGAKVGFNNIDAIKFNFEYYYGKEKTSFCRYIFKIALCCAGVCSLLAFAIGLIYPDPIVGVYIDSEASPQLFEQSVHAFRLYSPAFLPLGAVITLMGYFTSIELPKSAMSISVGRGLIFTSVFVLIFSFFFGETGVWTAAAASEICALVLALTLYDKKIRS